MSEREALREIILREIRAALGKYADRPNDPVVRRAIRGEVDTILEGYRNMSVVSGRYSIGCSLDAGTLAVFVSDVPPVCV